VKTRLILNEDIPTLGNTGDVVTVSAGYARNYLLPNRLALPYSEDAVRRIEKRRVEAEAKRVAMRADMEVLAKKLAGVQITFEEKVSEEGHLYGAVNARRLAERLAAEGFTIPENHVRLSEPIRQVGEYSVPIHVHADIKAAVKVWVVGLTQPAPANADEGKAAPAPAQA
jgi:large subunit ribosomal protein L9